MKRKTMEDNERERQERFEQQRLKTIEMLHPEVIHEMKHCADALGMEFEGFVEVLNRAARDPDYYESMGQNESYRDYNWDKIWLGWELLTMKKAPRSKWGPPIPFSCAC